MKIADIGSGTGIFTKHLLNRKLNVTCIEPNSEMREIAEYSFRNYPNFKSVEGAGEKTNIRSHSIDWIFVAQAFHWMDPIKTKREFARILKPGGSIAICWILPSEKTPFLKEFKKFREKYAENYKIEKRNDEIVLRAFFKPAKMEKKIFRFYQLIDFDSLLGLVLSMSFMPQKGNAIYPELKKSLNNIFKKYEKNGFIRLNYYIPFYWSSISFRK